MAARRPEINEATKKQGKKGPPAPKGKKVVAAPMAKSAVHRTQKASMSSTSTGVRVRHREYVAALTNGSTTGFAVISDLTGTMTPGDVNPTNAVAFPWLSQIAGAYEKYRFTSLKFELSTANPTTTVGRYWMAFDYDWNDPVPTGVREVMSNLRAVEAPVWQSTTLVVDPKLLNADMPYRYCNHASRKDAVETRSAWAGYLMVATQCAANSTFDLCVEYEVELIGPVFDPVRIVEFGGTKSEVKTAVLDKAMAGGYYGTALKVLGGCPLPMVTTGVEIGSPTSGATDWSGYTCYDIRQIPAGFLNLCARITSATTLGRDATKAEMNVGVLDSAGQMIGAWQTPSNSYISTGGCTPAQSDITNTTGSWYANVDITQLKNLYKNASYLLPVIFSATTYLGAGSLLVGGKLQQF